MSGHYRKAAARSTLSRDESTRQGRVVRAAAMALADTDAVRAFLNSHHADLGGRPLDLATASDAGLQAVETAIAAEALRKPRGPRLAAGDGA